MVLSVGFPNVWCVCTVVNTCSHLYNRNLQSFQEGSSVYLEIHISFQTCTYMLALFCGASCIACHSDLRGGQVFLPEGYPYAGTNEDSARS